MWHEGRVGSVAVRDFDKAPTRALPEVFKVHGDKPIFTFAEEN